MWAAYTPHAALTGWALARRAAPLPLPPGVAGVIGAGLVAATAGACVAGMTRFAGPEELTGTRNQELTTTGIYRYSRNPQYLGYLLAVTGAALARRSGAALGGTGALARRSGAAWIPVEEHHLTNLYGQRYLDYTPPHPPLVGRHRLALDPVRSPRPGAGRCRGRRSRASRCANRARGQSLEVALRLPDRGLSVWSTLGLTHFVPPVFAQTSRSRTTWSLPTSCCRPKSVRSTKLSTRSLPSRRSRGLMRSPAPTT